MSAYSSGVSILKCARACQAAKSIVQVRSLQWFQDTPRKRVDKMFQGAENRYDGNGKQICIWSCCVRARACVYHGFFEYQQRNVRIHYLHHGSSGSVIDPAGKVERVIIFKCKAPITLIKASPNQQKKRSAMQHINITLGTRARSGGRREGQRRHAN